jgi:transaldolase
MTQSTPTFLWNDSASICEHTYSIEHEAVGATCNPVIVLAVLKQELAAWRDRIRNLINSDPASGEDDLPWALGAQM